MNYSTFDGQQAGERILLVLTPHTLKKNIAIFRVIALSVLFIFVMLMISSVIPGFSEPLFILGIISAIILGSVGIWWNNLVLAKDRTYITDRRIMRFDVVSPFLTTKRSLFWNEVIKSKAYAPNLFFKNFNVGTIVVEPMMADHENIIVTDVYYYEDIANYIDKILYTVKNKPTDLEFIKPFVLKPKGERD